MGLTKLCTRFPTSGTTLRLLVEGRHPTTKVVIERHERVLAISQLQDLWPTVPCLYSSGPGPAGIAPKPGRTLHVPDPFGEERDEDYESFLLGFLE